MAWTYSVEKKSVSVFLGHSLLILGAFIFISLFIFEASAGLSVFEVKRNIPLSDSEPVYRDIYINGGYKDGLRRGTVVTVKRRITVREKNSSAGEMVLKVGKVKIIYVQKDMSIARETSIQNEKYHPVLEFRSVMTGDLIDLSTAVRATKKREKSATVQPRKPKSREISQVPSEKIIEISQLEIPPEPQKVEGSGKASENKEVAPSKTETTQ